MFRINAKKSFFNVPQIKYLGYNIDDGRSISRYRVNPCRHRPLRNNWRRSFLGFDQYYNRFVPNFSICDYVGTYLDSMQIPLPALKSLQLNIDSELIVDASERAVGAVLEHRAIRFSVFREHSTSCSLRQTKYSQTQKEARAIMWTVWRLILTKYKIIAEHQALPYIFDPSLLMSETASAMLQR